MKVLVVGSLPPPSCAPAEALRELVVGLLAEGHSVEVVALDPVATAHRYIVKGGITGCLRLARMVPSFDSVIVQVQPGLPVRRERDHWSESCPCWRCRSRCDAPVKL